MHLWFSHKRHWASVMWLSQWTATRGKWIYWPVYVHRTYNMWHNVPFQVICIKLLMVDLLPRRPKRSTNRLASWTTSGGDLDGKLSSTPEILCRLLFVFNVPAARVPFRSKFTAELCSVLGSHGSVRVSMNLLHERLFWLPAAVLVWHWEIWLGWI